ncbi:hypothetical protein V1511DRAFT_493398 [Dipodascopsis uninucleata]
MYARTRYLHSGLDLSTISSHSSCFSSIASDASDEGAEEEDDCRFTASGNLVQTQGSFASSQSHRHAHQLQREKGSGKDNLRKTSQVQDPQPPLRGLESYSGGPSSGILSDPTSLLKVPLTLLSLMVALLSEGCADALPPKSSLSSLVSRKMPADQGINKAASFPVVGGPEWEAASSSDSSAGAGMRNNKDRSRHRHSTIGSTSFSNDSRSSSRNGRETKMARAINSDFPRYNTISIGDLPSRRSGVVTPPSGISSTGSSRRPSTSGQFFSSNENYVIAQPPPRPGFKSHHQHLFFQLQQLTRRRALPIYNIKKSSQNSQFSVCSCDGEHDRAVAQAFGFDIVFFSTKPNEDSTKTKWRVRSIEYENKPVIAVFSSPSGRLVGRWIPESSDISSNTRWTFITPRGEQLAHLAGNNWIELLPSSIQRGFVGQVRFEEALLFSAIFISGSKIFGVPPEYCEPPIKSDALTKKRFSLPIGVLEMRPSSQSTNSERSRQDQQLPEMYHNGRHQPPIKVFNGIVRRGRSLLSRPIRAISGSSSSSSLRE